MTARMGSLLRCAVCHDAVDDRRIACAGCRTVTHTECAGPCPTLGCRPREVDRSPPASRPRRGVVEVVRRFVRVRPTRGDWLVSLALVALGLFTTFPVQFARMSVSSRSERVRADMKSILDAVDLFEITHGRGPVTLDQLVAEPLLKEVPVDPWGTPYELRACDRDHDVVSAGEDLRFGTDDDLSATGLGLR